MSKRPYRDFDLPVKLHPHEKRHEQALMKEHFIPPKAREAAEIDRRRGLLPGTLVAEYQYRGLAMAHLIVGQMQEKPSIDFSADTLAPAALNTAWYSFARGAEVMRRRLKLPILATADPEDRPTMLMLQSDASYYFKEAAENAMHLAIAINSGSDAAERLHRSTARTAGHAALVTACVTIGDQIGYEMQGVTDFDLQALARQRGLRAIERAQAMHNLLGIPPSIAQLADADSPLSVYWRRNGPNEAVDLYTKAYETMEPAKVA